MSPVKKEKKKRLTVASNTRDCGMTDNMFTAYENHLREKKNKKKNPKHPAQSLSSFKTNGTTVLYRMAVRCSFTHAVAIE